jgi:hypothetical protein
VSDELFTQEVAIPLISIMPLFWVRISLNIPDIDLEKTCIVVLLNVDVDGEMGVDVAHLVLEALGDTNDQVVDERADGAESGDVLARAMVNLDVDDARVWLLEADSQML